MNLTYKGFNKAFQALSEATLSLLTIATIVLGVTMPYLMPRNYRLQFLYVLGDNDSKELIKKRECIKCKTLDESISWLFLFSN